MDSPVTAGEARAALDVVDFGRRQVVDQIGLPPWYWCGLALGWVGLGVLADADHPVASAVATVAFGAGHAAVASRVLSGRRRTRQVTVRAELAGSRSQWLVVAGLLGLVVMTVLLALAANADGSRHPDTTAALVVAVAILLGGPQLDAWGRRRAAGGAA